MSSRSRHFRVNHCLLLGFAALAGCRSSIPSMGPLLNQTPTRVPAPATGSFQTPTSYAPQSPSITGGVKGPVSANTQLKSDNWDLPAKAIATNTSEDVFSLSSTASDSKVTSLAANNVVPASFQQSGSSSRMVGTGVASDLAEPNESSGIDPQETSSEPISDPRDLKPVPAVNVQWRSPNK